MRNLKLVRSIIANNGANSPARYASSIAHTASQGAIYA